MVQIGMGGGLDPNINSDYSGTIRRVVNGKTVQTDQRNCGDSQNGWPSGNEDFDIKGNYLQELHFDLTKCVGSSDADNISINFYDVTTRVVLKSITRSIDGLDTVSAKLVLRWNYSQAGTPTYLEELHKLDNFTKAQYVPEHSNVPI